MPRIAGNVIFISSPVFRYSLRIVRMQIVQGSPVMSRCYASLKRFVRHLFGCRLTTVPRNQPVALPNESKLSDLSGKPIYVNSKSGPTKENGDFDY